MSPIIPFLPENIYSEPGVIFPKDSKFIPVSAEIIELLRPASVDEEFRVVWSDRVLTNDTRNDGITYIHAFIKQVDGAWRTFIQKEKGWQSFVESEDEADKLLRFIHTQHYYVHTELPLQLK